MNKGITLLGFSAILFVSAISLAFQDQEELPKHKKKPMVIKESTMPKQFMDSLDAARRQFDNALKKNDSLWQVRVKNLNTLENNVNELKEANKTQKKAIGRLVNILRNFPADSTLKTFDMDGVEGDTIKKKSEPEVVEPQTQKKRGFFKRVFGGKE